MIVYENIYTIFYFDYDKKLLKEVWTSETENLKDDFAKKIMLDLIEILKLYKPKLLLNDYRQFKYTITPDFQKWIDENVGKVALDNGLRKKANIVSPDLIAQLSLEQTFGERYISKLKNNYFSTEEEAMQWLLNDVSLL